MGRPNGTFGVMPPDRSAGPEPEQPPNDDPLAGLRKLAGLAKDLGVTDVGAFTELLEKARNDGRGADLLKPLKSFVEQFAGPSETPSFGDLGNLGERLSSLVAGRNGLVERRDKAETALLRRIEELSRTATIEGVVDLATAFARLRSAGIGPAEKPAHDHGSS
jgi:hypothetical protein